MGFAAIRAFSDLVLTSSRIDQNSIRMNSVKRRLSVSSVLFFCLSSEMICILDVVRDHVESTILRTGHASQCHLSQICCTRSLPEVHSSYDTVAMQGAFASATIACTQRSGCMIGTADDLGHVFQTGLDPGDFACVTKASFSTGEKSIVL